MENRLIFLLVVFNSRPETRNLKLYFLMMVSLTQFLSSFSG